MELLLRIIFAVTLFCFAYGLFLVISGGWFFLKYRYLAKREGLQRTDNVVINKQLALYGQSISKVDLRLGALLVMLGIMLTLCAVVSVDLLPY